MKTSIFLIALALLGTAQAQKVSANESGETASDRIKQALGSHDLKQVLAVLPEIDKLWPQEPKKYAESIKKAAEALSASESNVGARSMITDLFSSILAKPLPEDAGAAIACLREKNDAVLYFLNFQEVREGKRPLIDLAKYVGSVRERIIPNFVPKQVYLNPPGLMNATPDQAKKIIAENEGNKAVNGLQQSLHQAEGVLTFHLLHNASQMKAGDSKNADFINAVASAAHLTKEEQTQLQ